MLQKRAHTDRPERRRGRPTHWPLLTAYECVDKCRGNLSPSADRPNCIAFRVPCSRDFFSIPSIYCTVIDILDHLEGFGTNQVTEPLLTAIKIATSAATTCECPTLAGKIYFNGWLFDLWATGMSPRLLFFPIGWDVNIDHRGKWGLFVILNRCKVMPNRFDKLKKTNLPYKSLTVVCETVA